MIGGWLSGPRSVAEAAGIDLGHPGKRLGLPPGGRNAIAGQGRRFGATFIDWMLAQLIALGLLPDANPGDRGVVTMAVFVVMNLALVTTIGAGIGGRLFGLRVARLDGANPNLLQVLLRTVLMAVVIPALIWDRDNRGLHDRASNSVVVLR